MTIRAKIRAKDIIATYGKCSITIIDDSKPDGERAQEKEFSNFDELVNEVEEAEDCGLEVYL